MELTVGYPGCQFPKSMDHLLDATARAEAGHFWFHGFRRFVTPFLERAVSGCVSPAILDCGCGTGHNLALLRRYGAAVGIDLDRQRSGARPPPGGAGVAQASAAALPFGPGAFDLVTSFDVLYALDDAVEAAALSEMFRVLRPGGHLVVNVAAMALLTGNHSVLAGEVRRYSRGSLSARLTRAGFAIERITYTNASIAPLVAAVRLLQRVSGHRESGAEISIPPAPLNRSLTAVLALEAAALRYVEHALRELAPGARETAVRHGRPTAPSTA